ncbi:response regulator transcription factor [Mucilaginibacter achroorhodeus]|uniref:Response regulator transcription factor n=1 Tax=Mucilaginibacter achroorhodeus TaxID=2599294 RepID=A0A563U5Z6_9SPHI|nr:LytTR family DNA-binding domain-containing protein [Mucilaginibacter achroorhodeus]TWR26777.1 response regulator transcription factor [Mucilaginibacter achroorhodeus]
MKLQCIVVDDEPAALDILARYIQRTPYLELSATYLNPLEALSAIPPDLAFVDVDMPGMNGLEFAKKCSKETIIVFTTSFREYAADAYEQAAADYLLKPVSHERFLRCTARIMERLPARDPSPALLIKDALKAQVVQIPADDVIRISGALDYVEFHLNDRKLMAYKSMDKALKDLPSFFVRVHRSHIINSHHISGIRPGLLTMDDHTEVPVGRKYQSALKAYLGVR